MEYIDKFTLDGRLKPGRNVTKPKVAKFKELFESGIQGDRVNAAILSESIASTDAILSGAHLVNLQVIPQFDDAPRTWSAVAGIREVPDFKPVVLQGIFGEMEGLQRQGNVAGVGFNNPAGILPVVPEAAPYPYATFGEIESAYGQLVKRGFKVGWTWEARINDSINFFADVPGAMLDVALDTEEWLVYDALVNGTQPSSQLAAQTTYTGAAVLANATISRDALVAAIYQLSQRKINGKNIVVTGGYNLIVPLGAGDGVRFLLNQQLFEVQNGSLHLTSSFLQDGVASTTVVESQYVTGTNWYLLPKPGATRRPVLELGRLRGHASPELRIENLAGNYAGAGAVSPFEGNFDNDTIDMRLRYPTTGILWNDDFVVWSQGDNVV